MNREIIFRAKCIEETCLKGKWLGGQILHDRDIGKYYIYGDNCLNESDNVGEEGLLRFVAYEIDPETVCQYIGSTDKNRKRIFEGDIVRRKIFEDFIVGQVVWLDIGFCGFYLKHGNKFYPMGKDEHTGINNTDEVVGNIFDNPELLEVKQ